jgi:hypothetical protein
MELSNSEQLQKYIAAAKEHGASDEALGAILENSGWPKADPVTTKPLEYTAKPSSAYTLCTTFATDSPKEERNGNFDFWIHRAGTKCFQFDAAEPVPQAPYFYYY